MKFGDIAQRAKKVIDQRGGTDALKKDAQQLKDIARGSGSLQEKAKKAAGALKEPGARREPGGTGSVYETSGSERPDEPPATPRT